MRWSSRGRSANLEDMRGRRMSRGAMIGGGGGLVGLVLALLFGTNLFGGGAPQIARGPSTHEASPEEEKLVDFVSFVLDDIQGTWTSEFEKRGMSYPPAKLVLFTEAIDSACGMGQAAMGPFYCPADQKAYIDLSFYDQLHRRFGAPGDFAQAYVLAHEIGHHIQNIQGVFARNQRAAGGDSNEMSVRQELQADCLAGVWGHWSNKRGVVEAGDLEEALRAANAIGDDTLQRQAQGRVVPDSFTHGSSEQRMRWFKRGFESGRMEDCDTYSTSRL